MEQPPHVLLHTIPAQGHIKPILCLAQLLSQAKLYVTIVSTHRFHKFFGNLPTLFNQSPNLHFEFISDGLPDDYFQAITSDFMSQINTITKPHFKEMVISLNSSHLPHVTCIINDQYMTYPFEVAKELEIPSFTFCAHGACFALTYFIVPKLIENGHLPFADDDVNHEIEGVPRLEGILRHRNLPEIPDVNSPKFKPFLDLTTAVSSYSSGLIINTFDELEKRTLVQLATHFRNVYSVGPLNALLNSQIEKNVSQLIGYHIFSWKPDQNCIAWLDSQPLKSVLYASFGSVIKIPVSQLWEFWHGLVDSGQPFLWVIRPDVILSGFGTCMLILLP